MKTIPMIFNGEMVRALIDGRKTQTRRLVKYQPFYTGFGWIFPRNKSEVGSGGYIFGNAKEYILNLCPAQKGDLIWVRETFRLFDPVDECDCMDFPCPCPNTNTPIYRAHHDDYESKWTPSIHMPSWASRLTLRVTNVRVERVQSITTEDAAAEGTISEQMAAEAGLTFRFGDRYQFKAIWERIYGDSWEKNEWVWVIEFEVIQKNIDLVLSEMRASA